MSNNVENILCGEISHIDATDGTVVVSIFDGEDIYDHYFPGRKIEADIDFKFLIGNMVSFAYVDEDQLKSFVIEGYNNSLHLLVDADDKIVDHKIYYEGEEETVAVNDNNKLNVVE